MNAIESIAARFATPLVYWIALLGLCAAYLQGGIVKATDFSGAIAEMQHFGLAPAAPLAIAVIVLELLHRLVDAFDGCVEEVACPAEFGIELGTVLPAIDVLAA